MNVPLAGYATKRLLRASARAHVYEAVRERDGRRVVAKVFELGDEGVEARVEHEFHLLEQLDIEGVVRALGVERVGERLVLLLEYIEGQNLEQYLDGRALDVASFLPKAISLAATLARVHERRVIHRDIKPSNILVESGNERTFLADFGISVLLESERAHVYERDVLEGTLPYISPEQTGRTTREVDFRSDLYSLGATFYELLTGRRPFEANEPLELIHAHLARRPTPPQQLLPTIPTLLSEIVMKLLEKAPEHRYQSARGLQADLERFADALTQGRPQPSFPLGELDHPTTLQLPHQLYGRNFERQTLLREFELVAKAGKRRLVLIGGRPGLGKSTLIHSIDAELIASRSRVARGRFELESREQPYRGFVRAFTQLVEQLLTESDERLDRRRRELLRGLGAIAGVVTALVPELSLVLGELPPVPELEPGEARNRLHIALARFIAVFAQDAPLVLILDDLQCADEGSLELLRVLLREGGEQPILFVGAHRSDALEHTPLAATITRLEQELGELTRIELQPIVHVELERMLADVLGRERAAITKLAEIVGRKTGSNPLFVRQFLLYLERVGLLRSDREGWHWDEAEIAAAPIPDDVVGVMQTKLEGLGAHARELVGIAACLGPRFDAAALEALSSYARAQVVAALYELEQSGLVHAEGTSFGFAHERIREVARASLVGDARRSLHWDIGELLLARYGDEAFGERVFEVVDQFDAGLPLDSMSEQRRALLTRLNLAAGQRALDSAAWTAARRYFELAVELLADAIARAPTQPSPEAFAACFGRAQAMALLGQNQAADEAFAALSRWPLSPEQRGRVLARRIKILDALERPAAALEQALAALAEFGVQVPRQPSGLQVGAAIVRMLHAVKGATRARMLVMPAMTDEREAAIAYLLAAANNPAWLTSQELWLVLMATHVRRVMKAGYHPTAPQGLSMVATVYMTMGKAVEAMDMIQVAIELAEQRVCTPAAAVSARSNLLTMVGPQCRPFREVAKPMEQAHRAAIEAGERYIAGFIGSIGLVTNLEAGAHLRDVLDIDARLRAVDASFGGPEIAVIAEMMRRFIHVLLGSEGASVLHVEDVEAKLSPLMRYVVISVEIWERTLFADVERGWALLEPLLRDYERVLLGSLVVPRLTMLAAILAFWRFRASAKAEQRRLRSLLGKLGKTSRRWAKIGPSNYQPMADIVAGVEAALAGRGAQAQRAFEAARTAALDNNAHYVAGLASMCLADWASDEGLPTTRDGARRSAREAFERMGARALVASLDHRHGRVLTSELAPLERSTSTRGQSLRSSLTADRTDAALDLASVLGTLQALGENLELEQVISRVLGSAIENAGADRGALLLERGGELSMVAEGGDTQTTHFVTTPIPLRDARDRLPTSALLYVLRTGGALVVDDMTTDSRFASDSYVGRSGVRALLCMPILKQSERIGALVLENHLSAGAFTPARLEILRILLGQAASALDNARLYAALARSEAQWRSLVEGVPDIIAVMDGNGQLEFVNHLSAYGPDASALIGKLAYHHMDPTSAERWRETFAAVRASHEPREVELCVAPESRERRWYNTRIAAIAPYREGSAKRESETKYLSISTDITERKQLETQVRQQQRLESIGTLASGVAHEINNPVQGILNYAELIHERADDPTTVREFSDEISRESERVATIVRNLLAFSRQEREQVRERVDVRKLVDSTLSLIHAVMRKDNVHIAVEVPADLPPMSCRPQQIQQIIMNLVTNARDALNSRYPGYHDDKRIEISAETFTDEGRPWMRIIVADHGSGIPADVRDRVFDPFFTTKGRDKGTGLGLSVSHGIAVDHGGRLRLESELGVGTRFFLELPLDENQ